MKGTKTQATPTAAINGKAAELTGQKDWDVKPELRIGGRTCQCAYCNRFFTGVRPFDLHMEGDDLRCMTDKELLKSGMTQNKYGVWQVGTREQKKA